MRELNLIRPGQLDWVEKDAPTLQGPTDALVRPFVASRCDGDSLPINLHGLRHQGMRLAMNIGAIDPVVGDIVGKDPFKGPFGIGHEAIAQVTAIGDEVTNVKVGDTVVVPWAISCGECYECKLGLTAKCSTMVPTSPGKTLCCFGFGPNCGDWGGVVSDCLRIPNADHMLVRVPDGVDPLRVASAGDNLTDAWRTVHGPLQQRPGGKVIVIGGGAHSIGLYAAGFAVRLGAERVDYFDSADERLEVAEGFGVTAHKVGKSDRRSLLPKISERYDVGVEASSTTQGLRDCLRALRPGGICTGTGYYLFKDTRLPVMDMYAKSASLHVGVSHVLPHLPEMLDFIARTGFEAERVTSVLADWDDAVEAYAARTTKVVLKRDPLNMA
ncbi:alcohol dehydrogenase catalytic domain-containing protein [Marinihelvus fidelis]|uniref:Alcohol dehydrogenase catalytic domain-containing protein n=1 Tax=Marinihelvus fidelis TaxID=2613842 RepID=A0A5N0T6C5_9GAMM|nr:alcohol dehydrogenase catalytic domain-containing protein [Marinihelvus fidelis]KAA9130513.1 alcohol dehydrogenase catalytic domain-containing protein [Marinihelvus fidelis]